MRNFIFIIYYIVIANLIITSGAFSKTQKCNFKQNICNTLDKVVGIKTPMMIASGTIIDDNFIVTNRHVVEDHLQFIIKFNNGEIRKAFPLPHNFPTDLALLSLEQTPQKLNKLPKSKQDLRLDLPTIGFNTLKDCKKYGLKGIVLKSKKNIFLDKVKCISFANKNKIFIKII